MPRPVPDSGWATRTSCAANLAVSLFNGDDYKLDELKDEAWRIMAVKRA